ncbi:MAG: NAD(P)/FAD-dependent oxidoreductase [Gemmobacter sp.]
MDLLTANDRPGEHPPSWYAATAVPAPRHPPLGGDARADLCVIGAGYTGLSAALHAARAGLSVIVLEAQRVGFGASGRNGGQVGSGQRLDQDTLEARTGRDAARMLWAIAEDAKALVRSLAADMPGTDWRDGIAYAQRKPADARAARVAAERLARDYGYAAIDPLDRAALAALIGTDVYAGGVLDRGAGHIHPLNFALGLAAAARAAGAAIHEGTRATGIARGAPLRVRTDRGTVTADHVVVAGNGYLGGLVPEVAARAMPINSFIVATEPLGDRAPLAAPVAVADDRFVVNYWRQAPDGRLLFGGAETYGYRFPADIGALVRRPLARVYPGLADVRIDHAWGGTLAITTTRAPLVTRVAPGLLAASTCSGHGVALSTMTGRILAETVAGQTGSFDVMAALAPPPFPGGTALRTPILVLAMTWFALRDRLGI